MHSYDKKRAENMANYAQISTRVKADHVSHRGKPCKGGTVRVVASKVKDFKQDQEVPGFCPGCGYIGPVRRHLH